MVRGTPGIARKQDARGGAGKHHRLPAGREGGDLVVFLVPGLDAVPAQAIVQGQVSSDAPAILRVDARVFVAAVESLDLALVVLAGNA